MSGAKIVFLDPGHGGKDPGAVGVTNLFEKDVCLNVALAVRNLLKDKVDVRLTRTTDVFLALNRRPAAAGSAAYVSIHCNAHTTQTANGTETFFRTGGTAESRRLAELLQRELIESLKRRNRGVKTANFRVLRQGVVPSALVELAFISNPEEERILRSPVGQQDAAEAISKGILAFLGIA